MNSLDMLNECTLCIRNCKVNRNNHMTGFCKASDKVMIAKAFLHPWEEPQFQWEKVQGLFSFLIVILNVCSAKIII